MKRFFLLAPLIATHPAVAQEQPANVWLDLVAGLASALSSADARGFLQYFDSSYTRYGQLEQYVVALVQACDVGSSIEIQSSRKKGNEVVLKVDWMLELSSRQGGSGERREAVVTLVLRKSKDEWKIVGFDPVEFLKPSGS